MKKLFALLLALAMVFCLAACGESKGSKDTTTEPTTEPTEEVTTAPTEEPTDATTEPVTEPENAMPAFDPAAASDLFGKWALTFEMTGAAMGLDDFNGSLAFVIYLTFNEDGSYIASVDEEEMATSLSTFSEGMYDYLVDMMYAQFAAEEMTEEEADEAMIQEYGMDVKEYCQAAVDSMGLENMIEGFEETGFYSVAGDKLYMDDNQGSAFKVEDNKLVLLDSEEFEELAAFGMELPVTLEKVEE